MPTPTTNYSFDLPVEGADDDVWGGLLNDNWIALDTQLFSGTIGAATTGNAATATLATDATTLATPRDFTIGATTRSFDGSADVTWTLGDIGIVLADKTTAEAGTNNTEFMTPLRTAEAIAALTPPVAQLTQIQVEDPASTVFGTVSGQRLSQAVAAFEALNSYESSQQTITTGGLLTLSHGLGGIPSSVAFTLVCITPEFGFSAGQHVDVANIDTTSSTGTVFSIGWVAARTSSEILVRFGSSAALVLINLSNGGIAFATPANWRLIVRAKL
jgi:hypothetical protein